MGWIDLDKLIYGLPSAGAADAGATIDLNQQALFSGVAAGLRGRDRRAPFSIAFPELCDAWLTGYDKGIAGQADYWNPRRLAVMGRCLLETSIGLQVRIGDTGSGADCYVIVEIEAGATHDPSLIVNTVPGGFEWHCLMRPRPALEVAQKLIAFVREFARGTPGQIAICLRALPLVVDDLADPPMVVVASVSLKAVERPCLLLTTGEALDLAYELIDHARGVMI